MTGLSAGNPGERSEGGRSEVPGGRRELVSSLNDPAKRAPSGLPESNPRNQQHAHADGCAPAKRMKGQVSAS
jgi:hypothetical protein